MSGVTIVGAPTSAGAYAPGQEEGPRALRDAGLLERLGAAGLDVSDAGDVEAFRWRPDPVEPRAANAGEVVARARELAGRVAAAAREDRVLVLGGDCTTGVGTVAGLIARGADPGLVYLDRHADLNVPASTIDGALDWMGVAHLLDVDGAVEALAGLGARRPLLAADRISYLALGKVTDFESEQIAARGIASVSLEATAAQPEAAAARALAPLADADAVAVHFDVDVVDFLDAPLAENTDRAPGLPLAAAAAALRALLRDPRVRAVTVTEFNPAHGDDARPAGWPTRSPPPSRRERAAELTAALVAIDSVNPALVPGRRGRGGGRAVRSRAGRSDAGLEATWLEATPGRPSVLVRARGTGGGRTLLLCGHLDTVGLEGMAAPHVPRASTATGSTAAGRTT